MDQNIRNKLRNVVTQCRRLLEDSISQELEGKYGIFAKKDRVTADRDARMTHLSDEEQAARRDILDHYEHIKARGFKAKDALDQLVREIAFTHLNRLCAYKMMEARQVYVGGQKFREAVSRGVHSNGVKFYLAEHPKDERLFNTGQQELAYRHFLDWLGRLLSEEIGILFNPNDPANRLYPPQRVLDQVIDLLNGGGINADETELREAWPKIWAEDETIGWVYQYFTPKELRDKARKESQAPRNSYELAFRNQFYTPRYVVEFLTDNTLGRIWYEMRKGRTRLTEQCRYMVRRPDEVFLAPSTSEGHEQYEEGCGAIARMLLEADESSFPAFHADDDGAVQRMIELAHCVSAYDQLGDGVWEWFERMRLHTHDERGSLDEVSTGDLLNYLFLTCRSDRHGGEGSVYREEWFVNAANEVRRRVLSGRAEDASQEQLLKAPVFIPHREKKDPRELKILDPACGSGHFLLYCFDLLQTIYEEAWEDPDLGPALQQDYPTLDDLRRAVPGLILARNLHGIDIDLRCTQIAALALWLQCQRAFQQMGLKQDRPRITRSNIVCAEPMPGEEGLLDEFLATLHEDRLERLIRRVLDVPENAPVRATPEMADRLCELVRLVWDKMKLAGEAGSLLKVEEELQEAIRQGQEQWEEKQPLFRLTEFAFGAVPKEKYLRFVTDRRISFWHRAEALVMAALDEFAEYSANGRKLLRKLFADDAMRGFAFVDLCRQRFNVVLMNPPFGDPSKPSQQYLEDQFSRTKNDLYSAFVERGIGLLGIQGRLGAITSRTGFFLVSFQKWREEVLSTSSVLRVFADLGTGVLDTALVETAAYCLERTDTPLAASSRCVFFRLSEDGEKEFTLLRCTESLASQPSLPASVFWVNPASFHAVPCSTFAYWVSDRVRKMFTRLPPFEGNGRHACVTNPAGDDHRYFRCWWEVPPSLLGHQHRWARLCKGGDFSRFYSDTHLVADWDEQEGTFRGFEGTVHRPLKRPASADWFFRPGLTYSTRTQLGFSARVLPAEAIFHAKGPGVFVEESHRYAWLGLMNSSVFKGLLELQMAFGSYEVGVVQRTPVPSLATQAGQHIGEVARRCVDLKRQFDTGDETTHVFHHPFLVRYLESTLEAGVAAWEQALKQAAEMLCHEQDVIDELAARIYGIDAADIESLTAQVALSSEVVAKEVYGKGDYESGDNLVGELILYAAGVAFGRWDIRSAIDRTQPLELPDPFSPLPGCSPGMLQAADGLPAKPEDVADDYPLRIDWDGILVDDPERQDDIVRRVREVLEVIWKDRAEAIEKEACEILGVKELRDYFRRPGKGGFWDDHVSRYSKSRRKAPIYWLLQSSKKNYALWLYYHRLDRDMLFKALVSYVEPKIRLEESRLGSLRSQKGAAGESGKGARKLDKDIERQEDFLSELRDFEDKLRRAADRHLVPDLNDGVVVNIAPLHELVPWKEARKYWDELLEGKYGWSSIGKQLREKGLVR